jgi:hypothetical protein
MDLSSIIVKEPVRIGRIKQKPVGSVSLSIILAGIQERDGLDVRNILAKRWSLKKQNS